MMKPTTNTAAIRQHKLADSQSYGSKIIGSYLLDLAILLTAHLIAVELRRTIPFGKFVGENYQWYSLKSYFLVTLSLTIAYGLQLLPARSDFSRAARRFCAPVIGMLITCLMITLFLPEQSGLQKVYFAVVTLLLLTLMVPIPHAREIEDAPRPLKEDLQRLWANRSLLRIWVQYNVQSRYAQAILGIFWIVLLPVASAVVMSVVFSNVLKVSLGSDVPFIAFFLAGLVPWGLFNQSIGAGMRSILGSMGLITQIYFPREIIVLSALGEALVDAAAMFAAMLIIDAAVGIWPNPFYLALPLLLLIQVALTLGLMLILSWLSAVVRDIPQLVSVLLQILFYLCPVIYSFDIVAEPYRSLLMLNPMAALIEAYRDIIVYGHAPVWSSLLLPAALGVGFLVFGYRFFKEKEDTLADLV